jgi:hypothetical protein
MAMVFSGLGFAGVQGQSNMATGRKYDLAFCARVDASSFGLLPIFLAFRFDGLGIALSKTVFIVFISSLAGWGIGPVHKLLTVLGEGNA